MTPPRVACAPGHMHVLARRRRAPLDSPNTGRTLENSAATLGGVPGWLQGSVLWMRRRVPPILINGVLYERPPSSFGHGHVVSQLIGTLVPHYVLGRDGPGGWAIMYVDWIVGQEVLRPDLSGWHASRLRRQDPKARANVVPDWILEVLSPNTTRRNHEARGLRSPGRPVTLVRFPGDSSAADLRAAPGAMDRRGRVHR
jgi:hypothetical protein